MTLVQLVRIGSGGSREAGNPWLLPGQHELPGGPAPPLPPSAGASPRRWAGLINHDSLIQRVAAALSANDGSGVYPGLQGFPVPSPGGDADAAGWCLLRQCADRVAPTGPAPPAPCARGHGMPARGEQITRGATAGRPTSPAIPPIWPVSGSVDHGVAAGTSAWLALLSRNATHHRWAPESFRRLRRDWSAAAGLRSPISRCCTAPKAMSPSIGANRSAPRSPGCSADPPLTCWSP
jgi:hypothetical protein